MLTKENIDDLKKILKTGTSGDTVDLVLSKSSLAEISPDDQSFSKDKPFVANSDAPKAKATADLEKSVEFDILSQDSSEVNGNLEDFFDLFPLDIKIGDRG